MKLSTCRLLVEVRLQVDATDSKFLRASKSDESSSFRFAFRDDKMDATLVKRNDARRKRAGLGPERSEAKGGDFSKGNARNPQNDRQSSQSFMFDYI